MIRTGRDHHADRVLAVISDASAAARSAVAASWVRSHNDYGLDPEQAAPPIQLEEASLAAAREQLAPLLAAAQSPLDRLFQAVGDAGCCVLLTNREGVPLERRGAAADDETFRKWGLWTGMVWDEPSEGTNGVGTCLAEGRALTIHREQHFYTRNTGLSCTVAPLHDHLGRLVGSLDVSSCRRDLDTAMLGLIVAAVSDTARLIEAANFRGAFDKARILLAPDGGSAALLAVDRDDLVVGATRAARRAHAITDERLAGGLPAEAIFNPAAAEEDLRSAERGAVQRALARAGGNVSAAARHLGVSRATLHRKLHRLGLAERS
ncbi:MAG: helix-turn-helix domain-containing protein [Caulobacteraceae bacterium]|nr:helix-turn-helix domain-containing protein [Caulobacteraceae bacterium]